MDWRNFRVVVLVCVLVSVVILMKFAKVICANCFRLATLVGPIAIDGCIGKSGSKLALIGGAETLFANLVKTMVSWKYVDFVQNCALLRGLNL